MGFFDFFKQKQSTDPLVLALRKAAAYSAAHDAAGEQAVVEEIFRLYQDRIDKGKRYQMYHILCDSLIVQHIFKEKVEEMLKRSNNNAPYSSDDFVDVALNRSFYALGSEATLAYAEAWYVLDPKSEKRQERLRGLLIRSKKFDRVAELSKILFETDENEFSMNAQGYLEVFDVLGEHEYVMGEKCECGTYFEYAQHNNRTHEGLTEGVGRCPQCKKEKVFLLSNNNETFRKNIETFMKKMGL